MICPECATAADAISDAMERGVIDQPTGHHSAICTDLLCTCQHQPIKASESTGG